MIFNPGYTRCIIITQETFFFFFFLIFIKYEYPDSIPRTIKSESIISSSGGKWSLGKGAEDGNNASREGGIRAVAGKWSQGSGCKEWDPSTA